MRFRKGDVVVCVRGGLHPFPLVRRRRTEVVTGEVYEVMEITPSGGVRVSGVPTVKWLPRRFELLGDVR